MSSVRAALAATGLALACAALLAACHRPAAHQADNGQPGANIQINPADLPHPRSGEWSVSEEGAGGGFHTTTCVTDRPFDIGKVKAYCQSFVYHRTATGGIVVDAQCGKGPVSSSLHVTAEGDFGSAYATDTQMSFTLGAGQAAHVTHTRMNYRYLGPCPATEAADAGQAAKGE